MTEDGYIEPKSTRSLEMVEAGTIAALRAEIERLRDEVKGHLTAWDIERADNERLTLENWQLKGALGYPVPGDIPQGPFKCGLCEARARESKP